MPNDFTDIKTVPEQAKPLTRNGLPTQPMWLLLIQTVITSVAVVFGCSVLSGSLPLQTPIAEGISYAVLGTILFYLFRTCRFASRRLPALMLLLSFSSCWLCGSALPVLITVSVIFCAAQTALLLAVSPKNTVYGLPLIPLCAYLLSLLTVRNPMTALLCLVPFPAGAVLAWGTVSSSRDERQINRVGVICLTSLTLGVTALVAFCLALNVSMEGEFSLSALKDLFESARAEATASLIEWSRTLTENTDGSGSFSLFGSLFQDDTGSIVTFTEGEARQIVNSAVNLLPAALVIFFNITAALTQSALFGELGSFGYSETVRGHVVRFRLSNIAGVTYLIALTVTLVSTLITEDSTPAGTVAENVTLILQPGLALCGFMRLTVTLFARRSGAGCLPVLMFLFAPLLLTLGSTLLASFESVGLLIELFIPHRSDTDASGSTGDSP